MDTLEFIATRYQIDLKKASSPIAIPKSRFDDLGNLIKDLKMKVGIEVGIYKGEFTACLAKKAPKTKIIGLDSWTVYEGYKDDVKNDLHTAQEAAVKNTKDYPNVELIKGWSDEVVNRFKDGSLDFVFIDANHSYEYVVADIAAWSKKVKKGGLVMGHDYKDDKKHALGAKAAVDGWCSSYDIKPLFTWTDKTPSWMYVK
jgi:predicted O-methyltransferase YrrM